MSLLDDPALRLRAKPPSETVGHGVCARLLPGSAWAQAMSIPDGAIGTICGRYEVDGRDVLAIMIDGVGYCTGVPRAEVERV